MWIWRWVAGIKCGKAEKLRSPEMCRRKRSVIDNYERKVNLLEHILQGNDLLIMILEGKKKRVDVIKSEHPRQGMKNQA